MDNRKAIYLDDAMNTMRQHSHYDDFDRCVIDESVAMKALKDLQPAQPETKQQTLNIEDVAVEASCYSLLSAYDWLKILQDLDSMGFAFIRRGD